MRREAIARVVAAYDDPVTRAYSRARFLILRQRFLDEIGQYLPADGDVLDIGCGFGLFSLYYAQVYPRARFHGIDLDARRIARASRAAARLGLENVAYAVGDARGYRAARELRAVYMLDIIHHIPPETVEPLLRELWQSLMPGGRLVVKDVDTRLLERVGFRVYRHLMVDVLPYPHVLYICTRVR